MNETYFKIAGRKAPGRGPQNLEDKDRMPPRSITTDSKRAKATDKRAYQADRKLAEIVRDERARMRTRAGDGWVFIVGRRRSCGIDVCQC